MSPGRCRLPWRRSPDTGRCFLLAHVRPMHIKKSPGTGNRQAGFLQRVVRTRPALLLEQERVGGVADKVPPVHVGRIRVSRRRPPVSTLASPCLHGISAGNFCGPSFSSQQPHDPGQQSGRRRLDHECQQRVRFERWSDDGRRRAEQAQKRRDQGSGDAVDELRANPTCASATSAFSTKRISSTTPIKPNIR
jgi:hypothetical protein